MMFVINLHLDREWGYFWYFLWGFFVCFCFFVSNLFGFFVVIDLLSRQGDINLLMSATVFVKRITRKNQIIQGTSSLSELVPNYVFTIHSGYKFSRVEFL